MIPHRFISARDLFQQAREASRDAERIRRQLVEMRERSTSLGGGGFEPRVRTTPDHDSMGTRVSSMVDRERALAQRQAEDYELIDLACAVLYGSDGREQGLAQLVPEPWWADVLWWRYLDDSTWEQVGRAVGYSSRRCFDVAQTALDIADEYGLARTISGQGFADDRERDANETDANEREEA